MVEYIPRENNGENFGLAFFPVLEILGQAAPKDIRFPSPHALETELCEAMRAAVWANTIKADDYMNKWEEDEHPAVTGSISHQWPNPGKQIKKKASNTGNILSFIRSIM